MPPAVKAFPHESAYATQICKKPWKLLDSLPTWFIIQDAALCLKRCLKQLFWGHRRGGLIHNSGSKYSSRILLASMRPAANLQLPLCTLLVLRASRSFFIQAAENGHFDLCKLMLKQSPDLRHTQDKKCRRAYDLVTGDKEDLRNLLAQWTGWQMNEEWANASLSSQRPPQQRHLLECIPCLPATYCPLLVCSGTARYYKQLNPICLWLLSAMAIVTYKLPRDAGVFEVLA